MRLEINKVTKDYGDFKLDCTMEVNEGCITGLIGRNGAGKSTTFKSVLGLIKPDSGVVTIDGKDVREFDSADREKIGVVLSDSGFSGYLNIKDVTAILKGSYKGFDEGRFVEMCRRFQLTVDKKIMDFSTGMKAKLKILAAMSYGAKFLVLDEPTSGLDVVARDEILDMLREFMENEGNSVLISSHISSDLEGLCDDVYLIDDGTIVLHEETGVLLDEYAVIKVKPEQYEKMDKAYIVGEKKEKFGYSLLTDKKQFYVENYPDVAIEKSSVDQVISIMISREER